MDERELEQRLRTAVEHAAPDPLDRILAACGPQAGTVLPFEAPKKKRRWAPLGSGCRPGGHVLWCFRHQQLAGSQRRGLRGDAGCEPQPGP